MLFESRVIWLLIGISRTSSAAPKFGLGVTPVVFPLEFLLKVQHRRRLKEKAD
jgi:hypothetical protein